MGMIEKEDAKKAICEACYMYKYVGDEYTECRYYPCDDIKALDGLPSIEERPTGTWHDSYGFAHCGVCGCGVPRPIGRPTHYKYCPYCGAKNSVEGSDDSE